MTTSPLSDYLPLPQAAERLGISRQATRSLCTRGHLAGAVLFGGSWLIPRAAIAARNSAKKRGNLPKNQHKARPAKALRESEKSS